MRILFLHPEGNLAYNPNLSGILEVLGEAGHETTYVARRRSEIHQAGAPRSTAVVLLDHPHLDGRFVFTSDEAPDLQRWGGYDLVIGIDRGVIEAARIARHFRIPHAQISYEIFFDEETAAEKKAPEIEACRGVAFAVAQDDLRARKLSLANRIPPERIVQIPVAARGYRGGVPKLRRIHEMFGFDDVTRVALYAGSLADWTAASFLLSSTQAWPEDWKLVIHERFGPSSENAEQIRTLAHPDRVRVSANPFHDSAALSEFIASADLGIAIYRPTYANEWVGKNIEHIGLASGKISGYLQHGVPVACNELGEISDWIRFYGAGEVFSFDRDFVPLAPSDNAAEACRKLFERHLDLDRFARRLLDAISRAAVRGAGD